MESIDGTIGLVLFHKPSRYNPSGEPFLIAKLIGGTIIKGNMRRPVEGEPYRFWGELKAQKNGYEDAFEFHSYEPICERSAGGVESYLAAHIDGVGRAKAAALVGTFGEDTLDVLRRDPEKALEVSGINETHIAAIRAHFADTHKFDPSAYAKLIDLFADFRISKKVVEKLLKAFGSSAPRYVRDHPYLLMMYPRVGWKTADAFALSKVEYDPDGLDRHEAAVREALDRIAADGHTCATETEVLNQAEALLGSSLREDALILMVDKGDVVEDFDDYGPVYQLPRLADAEATIADKLGVLMTAGQPLPFDLVTDEWVRSHGISGEQAKAAAIIADNPVVLLCGAPGCGKSWLLSRILGRLIANGTTSIRVVAPTGKAAKRAAELLRDVEGCQEIPCSTIHKALMPVPSEESAGVPTADARFGRGREEFGFGRNEELPLEEQVVVVDETSMVDCRLMASLLRAIKPGTRVIFVGDHNQLPSVGPGSVLRDMMDAGIPLATLDQIRRSDGGGTVVRACHSIKDGIVPHDAPAIDLAKAQNWIHLEIDDPREIAAKIVELHATTRTFDPVWDMQVVSPQKAKLPIGCDNLNRLLSRQLNPEAYDIPGDNGRDESEEDEGGPPFRAGDKIVRTKNGLADELIEFQGTEDKSGKSVPDIRWQGKPWVARQIPIVNGDMGQVRDIILDSKPSVIVQFRDPERLCRLPLGDSYIIPAYAMTVHRCQGSGFPYVVVPVHHSFYFDPKSGRGIFTRELVYTAISRAERLLITVGQHSALAAAVGRRTVGLRKTTLARRLAAIGIRPNSIKEMTHGLNPEYASL